MVRAHHLHKWGEGRYTTEDSFAVIRMQPVLVALRLGEFCPRALETVGRHRDDAEVVHERGAPNLIDGWSRTSHDPSELLRYPGHAT